MFFLINVTTDQREYNNLQFYPLYEFDFFYLKAA